MLAPVAQLDRRVGDADGATGAAVEQAAKLFGGAQRRFPCEQKLPGRELVVDRGTLRVQDDGILETATGMPRIIRADDEELSPRAPAAAARRRRMQKAGLRIAGRDVKVPHRLLQSRCGLSALHTTSRNGCQLLEHALQTCARHPVDLIAGRCELADEPTGHTRGVRGINLLAISHRGGDGEQRVDRSGGRGDVIDRAPVALRS